MAAAVNRPEHIGHAQRVLDVLVVRIGEAGAHPVEVGPGAEVAALARQHNGA